MPDTNPQTALNQAELPPNLPPASSDQEADIIGQMSWVLSADPLADAQSSLASGAPELIAFSARFKSYPGLSPEEQAQISSKTSDKFPAGSADVLYGEAHSILRRALNDYAKIYNQAIYQALR